MVADFIFIFIFWGIYPFQLLNIDCLNKLEKKNCGDTVHENIRRFPCLVLYMSHRRLLVGLLGDRCFLCFSFLFFSTSQGYFWVNITQQDLCLQGCARTNNEDN